MNEKKYIFLSYSRQDEDFAFQLRDDLVELGFDIWMDQVHIPVGLPWDDVIDSALKSTKLLILIISPDSVNSQIVKAEVLYAQKYNIPFLPIYYKETEIPFWWERHQFIVLNEKNYKQNFPKLVESIKLQLKQPSQFSEENLFKSKKRIKKIKSNFVKYIFLLLTLVLLGIGGYIWYQMYGFVMTSSNPDSVKKEFINEKNESGKNLPEVSHIASLKMKTLDKKEITKMQMNQVVSSATVDQSKKNQRKEKPPAQQKEEKQLYHSKSDIPVAYEKNVIKKVQEASNVFNEEGKEILVSVTQKSKKIKPFDAPYDEEGVVRQFIKKINNGENVTLVIIAHNKAIDAIDEADEKVRNLEELFIKKGLKNCVKTIVSNDEKEYIEYQIEEVD